MDAIFNQVNLLFSSNSGAAAVQFILLVLTLLILQDFLLQRSRKPATLPSAALETTIIMVFVRVVYFLISGIIWFSSDSPENLNPVLLRTADFLTLLLMIWLVHFTRSIRPGRIIMLISGALATALGIFLTFYWSTQNAAALEDYWFLFHLFEILGLFLCLFGLIFSLRKREKTWSLEAFIFGLPALAYLIYFFQLSLFPVTVLTSIIVSMVLLLFWARQQVFEIPVAAPIARLPEAESIDEEFQSIIESLDTAEEKTKGKFKLEENAFNGLMQNILSMDKMGTSEGLSTLIGKYFQADHCMILTESTDKRALELSGIFSPDNSVLFREQRFSRNEMPGAFDSLVTGRPFHILPRSTTEDLDVFKRILGTGETGRFLILPIVSTQSTLRGIIALHTLDEEHIWKTEDQLQLGKLVPRMARYYSTIHQSRIAIERIGDVEKKLEIASNRYRAGETEKNYAVQELEQLKTAYTKLHQEMTQKEQVIRQLNLGDQSPGDFMDSFRELGSKYTEIKARYEELMVTVEPIQSENTELTDRVETLETQLEEASQAVTSNQNSFQIALEEKTKELESTLENTIRDYQSVIDEKENESQLSRAELDTIKESLKEANEKISNLKVNVSAQATSSIDQQEVVASITQDLRQPLQSILGYTDLLLEESVGILGALQRKFLDRIKTSTERMNTLITDLIKIVTIGTDEIELKPQQVDIVSTIDKAVKINSNLMMEKGIQLNLGLDDNLPLLHTDQDAVEQILNNLITNACLASPSNGEVVVNAVEQNEGPDNNFILVQVIDSGGGVPTEEIPRVFSRLYRADNPLIEGIGDTGVGLSIAKTLAEALNGRIWIESEMGVGSTFSVLLRTMNITE